MVQLALVDPVLMLVGLALFPSLALLNRLYTRRVERPAAQAQARVGEVSAVAHESFDGALLVKTLGLETAEVARLRASAERLRDERLVVGRLRAAFEPGLDALPNLGTVVLLWLGAWRLSTGAVTIGDLVQAMALFGILAFPFRVVGYLLEELPRAVVANDRVQGVLAAPRRRAPDEVRPLPAGALEVVLHDVAFAHGDEVVLDGVSAHIRPGEVVALVGATGTGKTTLCTLLAGLVEPTAGELRLGGVALTAVDPAELHRATALVFQEAFLFADTVRENLTLGEPVPDEAVTEALEIARARGFVERLPGGLDGVIGERGVTLSGGQRQRIALARALLRKPRLLLLDDATSAVDPRVERAIVDRLRSSIAATTIVVAHRVSTIALADRVLLLEGGRITAEGTHRELLAVPAYAALGARLRGGRRVSAPPPAADHAVGSADGAHEGSLDALVEGAPPGSHDRERAAPRRHPRGGGAARRRRRGGAAARPGRHARAAPGHPRHRGARRGHRRGEAGRPRADPADPRPGGAR